MGKVIGIDLGTTNSCVAVLEGGQPIVIPNTEGGRTTPSIVAFSKGDDLLVGQLAKRQAVTNAENTIYSVKRFIGRRWEETEQERSTVPYNCVSGRDNTVDVQIRDKVYTPQQISARVLKKLKQDAENYLGEPVDKAVITVPAYFTDAQRQATKNAGQIAGLEVLRIINEPTAAALSYGLDKQDVEQRILVFDLGGGTFDVSILQLGDGVFEVNATAGNNHLGGDDFDQFVLRWIAEEFKKQEGIDLSSDKMATQRLREAAERAKIELSSTQSTAINLPFITADETGPKNLEMELSRPQFETLVSELVQASMEPVEQALKDSGLKMENIDRIILVGGSTRIPAVQHAVSDFFGGKIPDRSVNPDEAVALGAAIQAGVLGGEVQDLLLLDVTPLSLGIETLGGVFTRVIERNTTIPSSKSQVFSTAVDGQRSVEIQVLQGERAMAEDNKSLGQFLLEGIPPAPRGLPQIEVTFEIDADGILNVSALDKGTDKVQSISISNTGGLSGEEVDMMRREADFFAEEDQRRQAIAALRNEAENLIVSYEGALEDNAALLDEITRQNLLTLVNRVRSASANDEVEENEFQEAVDELRQGLLDIGRSVYGEADDRKKAAASKPTVTAAPAASPAPASAPSGSHENRDHHSTEEILEGLEDLIDGPSDATRVADPAMMSATAQGGSPGNSPSSGDSSDLEDDLDLGGDDFDLDLGDDLDYDSATVTADYEAIE